MPSLHTKSAIKRMADASDDEATNELDVKGMSPSTSASSSSAGSTPGPPKRTRMGGAAATDDDAPVDLRDTPNPNEEDTTSTAASPAAASPAVSAAANGDGKAVARKLFEAKVKQESEPKIKQESEPKGKPESEPKLKPELSLTSMLLASLGAGGSNEIEALLRASINVHGDRIRKEKDDLKHKVDDELRASKAEITDRYQPTIDAVLGRARHNRIRMQKLAAAKGDEHCLRDIIQMQAPHTMTLAEYKAAGGLPHEDVVFNLQDYGARNASAGNGTSSGSGSGGGSTTGGPGTAASSGSGGSGGYQPAAAMRSPLKRMTPLQYKKYMERKSQEPYYRETDREPDDSSRPCYGGCPEIPPKHWANDFNLNSNGIPTWKCPQMQHASKRDGPTKKTWQMNGYTFTCDEHPERAT